MMVDAISTALSGLNAASRRVEASASNIANSTSTIDLNNETATPALTTTQSAQENGGVRSQIIPRDPAIVESFAPNSPFANEQGFVGAPNVNLAEEAVNLRLADIAYRANIATLQTTSEINEALLDIFDDD